MKMIPFLIKPLVSDDFMAYGLLTMIKKGGHVYINDRPVSGDVADWLPIVEKHNNACLEDEPSEDAVAKFQRERDEEWEEREKQLEAVANPYPHLAPEDVVLFEGTHDAFRCLGTGKAVGEVFVYSKWYTQEECAAKLASGEWVRYVKAVRP